MKTANPLLRRMGKKHLRNSKARVFVATILQTQHAPQSVPDMLVKAHEVNVHINKTTLYRELESLEKLGIITSVVFPDGTKRFEFKLKHHHHVVCTHCNAIQEIDDTFLEERLNDLQAQITNQFRYKNVLHHLEFTGLCKSCSSVVP